MGNRRPRQEVLQANGWIGMPLKVDGGLITSFFQPLCFFEEREGLELGLDFVVRQQ
jgi:hypothetical protein